MRTAIFLPETTSIATPKRVSKIPSGTAGLRARISSSATSLCSAKNPYEEHGRFTFRSSDVLNDSNVEL